MNKARTDALMKPPEKLVRGLTNDRKDRHVLALAVHVGAPTIVTNNLEHFLPKDCEPQGVEAVDLATFALNQVDLSPDRVLASVDAMAARRRNPTITRDAVIERLSLTLLGAMDQLRRASEC